MVMQTLVGLRSQLVTETCRRVDGLVLLAVRVPQVSTERSPSCNRIDRPSHRVRQNAVRILLIKARTLEHLVTALCDLAQQGRRDARLGIGSSRLLETSAE